MTRSGNDNKDNNNNSNDDNHHSYDLSNVLLVQRSQTALSPSPLSSSSIHYLQSKYYNPKNKRVNVQNVIPIKWRKCTHNDHDKSKLFSSQRHNNQSINDNVIYRDFPNNNDDNDDYDNDNDNDNVDNRISK